MALQHCNYAIAIFKPSLEAGLSSLPHRLQPFGSLYSIDRCGLCVLFPALGITLVVEESESRRAWLALTELQFGRPSVQAVAPLAEAASSLLVRVWSNHENPV
jgi:hypothetical protein